MSEPVKVEYRIRPVTRYILTKYEATENTGGSEQVGEYDNPDVAYAVGYALCKQRHELLGWPLDDTRIRYPDNPAMAMNHANALNAAAGKLYAGIA